MPLGETIRWPGELRRRMKLCGGVAAAWLAIAAAGCGERQGCRDCDTVVVSATGEPEHLLPPLVFETVGRDISDLVFERLADLAPGAPPIDSSAYWPRLAARWERVDPVTWRFHLRPGARWHDGRPVTAGDVVFSFEAYADSALDAAARPHIAGRVTAAAEDSVTVRLRFDQPSAEQLYDATYHVRVPPRTSGGRSRGSGGRRTRRWRTSSAAAPTGSGRGDEVSTCSSRPTPLPGMHPPSGAFCFASRQMPMPRSTWC